jgi:hypothetical protein
MRRLVLLGVSLLVVTAVVAGAGAARAEVPQRQTGLTGSAESPGPGDGNGRGEFTWSLDGERLCYLLSVKRIDPAAAAHIHRGRQGVAGPVVVELAAPAPRASAECLDLSTAVAKSLRKNPGRFYVNVHNASFPDGAIRGQLHR